MDGDQNRHQIAQNIIDEALAGIKRVQKLTIQLNEIQQEVDQPLVEHMFYEFEFGCAKMQTALAELYKRMKMDKPKFN